MPFLKSQITGCGLGEAEETKGGVRDAAIVGVGVAGLGGTNLETENQTTPINVIASKLIIPICFKFSVRGLRVANLLCAILCTDCRSGYFGSIALTSCH